MTVILQAIFFGIVEGITEWLPVSSTGHMILVNEIWPMQVNKDFMSMFLVVIQLGAILAVMVYFTLTSSILSNRLRTNRKFVRLGDYG